MDSLRSEIVPTLKSNLTAIRDSGDFIIEYFSFGPLFRDLQPRFRNGKSFSKATKRIAGSEFVRTNLGKKIYLQNRSANLTPENLIALTFFRTRERILQSKDAEERSGFSGDFLDYNSLSEIFEQDYLMLESLLFDPNITYTSNCILDGVTGSAGKYRIGEFDIEVKALSGKDTDLTIARVGRKHIVSKEKTIFTEKQEMWDTGSAQDDFLELVAIFNMLNPDNLVFLHDPKVTIDLLTLTEDKRSTIYEKVRIEALARAERDWESLGRKRLNLTERLIDGQRLWQMIQSLNNKDKDRIDSAIRRYAIGTLRANPTDSTVDFAVALETLLFERDTYKEISYKLRMRAGVLTNNFEETYEIVNTLYKRRSGVLHSNASFDDDSREFLIKVRHVVSEMFIKAIEISSSSRDKSLLYYLDEALTIKGKDNLTKYLQSPDPKTK
ncbi:MAG: HEPN domain-containing protein [Candidatus Thermoplasmatota archaeon]|jgi:hypothetical protein|nr:HEPN domain-containing protein [Candidatus Thermoplasmatota archaeon]